MMLRSGDKKIRRNSLTTLHSLPAETDSLTLNRQTTVPHGFKVGYYGFKVGHCGFKVGHYSFKVGYDGVELG
jgi:hypothetical protein